MATRPDLLRCLCCGSLLLLTACATPQNVPEPATGDTSWTMRVPVAGQRYSLPAGHTATGANLARSVSPVYPAAELSACPPPQEVQALVVVDKAGGISEIRITDAAQAEKQARPFKLAVREAVMQWRFNPLQVQHDGLDANNDPVVISETRPFSLAYVFRFACHGGKATVTTDKSDGRRP